MARSGLISSDNDIFGGQEPDNETDNFVSCSLDHTIFNLIITAKAVGIFPGSCPHKLLVSIATDQLARYGLIDM